MASADLGAGGARGAAVASVETSETWTRGDEGKNVGSARGQIGWCEGRWAGGLRGARFERIGTAARAKPQAHLDGFFTRVLGCVPRLPAAAMTPRRTTRALVARLGANCAVRDTGIAAVADMAAMVVEGPVGGSKSDKWQISQLFCSKRRVSGSSAETRGSRARIRRQTRALAPPRSRGYRGVTHCLTASRSNRTQASQNGARI